MHSDGLVGMENSARAKSLLVLRLDLAETGLGIRAVRMNQHQHAHTIQWGVCAAPPTRVEDREPRREARHNHLGDEFLPGLVSDYLSVCRARTEVNLGLQGIGIGLCLSLGTVKRQERSKREKEETSAFKVSTKPGQLQRPALAACPPIWRG